MDQLINLAFDNPLSPYYGRLLNLALSYTGPLAIERDEDVVLCTVSEGIPALPETIIPVTRYAIPMADVTLVPDSILPFVHQAARGDDFPAGIPFRELE